MSKIIGGIDLTFETELIAYQIHAGLDISTQKFNDPTLSFIRDWGLTHEKYIEWYDNSDYLYNTLYSGVILPWVVEKTTPHPQEFANLLRIEGVRLEDFEGLYELFNKAIEMKFFEK